MLTGEKAARDKRADLFDRVMVAWESWKELGEGGGAHMMDSWRICVFESDTRARQSYGSEVRETKMPFVEDCEQSESNGLASYCATLKVQYLLRKEKQSSWYWLGIIRSTYQTIA